MIPSVAQCFQFMDQYEMLENIRDHSIMVARIGELLALELVDKGVEVNIDLVVAGALMHDIAKTACLDNDRNHAGMGREICRRHGLDEIADIVGDHVWLKAYGRTEITEKEIVYYADKRVNHDCIVPLEERRQYIIERYGNEEAARIEAIAVNCRNWHVIEEKIFAQLEFNPADIDTLLADRPSMVDPIEPHCPGNLKKKCRSG